MKNKEDRINNILKIIIFSIMMYGLLSFYEVFNAKTIVFVMTIVHIILNVYLPSVSIRITKTEN